jgi:hypothetical protein
MQAGLLQDIFERLSGAFVGLAPEQQTAGRCAGNLDDMVEHVVDGSSSRLRAVPGYARSLRGPLASTFRYIDRMVEAIPGPLPCCRSAFSEDPRINAFFVSPQHIQEVFSQSREVRDLFDANPLAGECWALMCVRQQERTQIGMAMVDGQVRKDVLQTVVSFTDHQLHSPGTDEATARCALKCCMFNGLLAHIRRRANDALSRAADLEHRIALAHRRLRGLGQDPAREPARSELRAETGVYKTNSRKTVCACPPSTIACGSWRTPSPTPRHSCAQIPVPCASAAWPSNWTIARMSRATS